MHRLQRKHVSWHAVQQLWKLTEKWLNRLQDCVGFHNDGSGCNGDE